MSLGSADAAVRSECLLAQWLCWPFPQRGKVPPSRENGLKGGSAITLMSHLPL